MKDELQGNEPAMPTKCKVNFSEDIEPVVISYQHIVDVDEGESICIMRGLSKIEYACIHLELPESGTPWLDKLIAKKQRQSIAEKAMQALLSNVGNEYYDLKDVTGFTDSLLSELNKK